jgi:hypothetical protein
MSTLDTIVKDYDKSIVLRDCQRQAFEYLHDKKGDLLVTTLGTTFETFAEIESLQEPTTLYGRLMKFMKTQDKNTQISVYCIQHYCK